MSSFFSTLAESLLMELSTNMATLELLHTVSIEFTVMRENNSVNGLEIHIQYLLAEQKQMSEPPTAKIAKILHDNPDIKRI